MAIDTTFADQFRMGLEAGRARRRREQDDARDDEERKLRIETLRHQQKQLDLEGKYKAFERQRTAAEGESKQLEGQPLAKLLQTRFVQPGQETPPNAVTAMNEAGLPALATQQRRQVQIPGSEEFGIPGRTDTPQSFEELLGQQRATKVAQQGLVNVAPGGAVYDPVSEEVEFRNPPRETRQPSEPQKSMEQQLLEAETSGNAQQAAAIRRVMNARDDKPNATLQAIREMQLTNLKTAQSQGGLPPAQFNQAKALADDYARDSKDFMARRSALQAIYSAGDNAAGDLSLIFSFMKMLDPGSVVREQEYANAQNAAGVPDQVRNLYNRVKDGRRLNPEQRRQFAAQAEELYQGAKQGNEDIRAGYGQRAQAQGIDPKFVTFDLPDPKPRTAAGGKVRAKDPQGNIHEAPAGTPLPAGWVTVN